MPVANPACGAEYAPPALVEVVVDRPPALPRRTAGSVARLMPAVTLLTSLGAAAVLVSGQSGLRNPMLLLFPVIMAVSAVGAIVGGGVGQRSADLDADRRRYLDYLAALSSRLTEDAGALRDWLTSQHPMPEALWAVVGDRSMWARTRGAPGFCVVRVGLGTVAPSTRLVGADQAGFEERDPVTAAALARLLHAHARVVDAPVTVELTAASTVTVLGDAGRARALVRAMICQLAVLHNPADLGIAAVVGEGERADWEWLKWLPHHLHPALSEDSRSRDDRRMVVVVDADADADAAGQPPGPHITVLRVGPSDATAGEVIRVVDAAGATILDRPDRMTVVQALAVARRIAGHRPRAGRTGGSADWLDRVGIANLSRIDPQRLWERGFGDPLSVPIGIAEHGAPIDLDIREAAAGGMGPHGLCLGATGSGKSELLRTIVLGMIARHSPDALNLILVDFKGGATFLDLANTRHTAALITNLADESYHVDRMAEALTGEVDRRQRILRAAGNLASIAEYGRARFAGRSLAPLPALFIVVDEFSELLSRHPEFVDVFIAIGRLGRSLGMHLLLASQRLDEGRLRGLDSHLSYRICLKTLSANESRTAIGGPDAYHLPGAPGAAYLKVADAQPVRFQASFVSGRLEPARARRDLAAVDRAPRLFTAVSAGGVVSERPAAADRADPARTLLQYLVGCLTGAGSHAHQVWLTPLADSPRLETLVGEHDWGELRVPIGVVDRTFEHRRCPLALDLAGPAGHVAVVGAPQTGKTTALRTLVTALAATHEPRRVQFYCLDFGGGLGGLETLPHVGAVAGRSDNDLARRMVAEIRAVLHRRETRQASVSAAVADPYGDVFLVIDGWSSVRPSAVGPSDDGLDEAVAEIATRGLSCGVHLVLSASRWADIRPALRDQIGTRLELRLGEPADSELDRARARQVPRGRPGHGLCPEGSPMVIALPGNGFREFPDNWRAPAVRVLPERIDYAEVLSEVFSGDLRDRRRGSGPDGGPVSAHCVLGTGEDLMPVMVDFTDASQQHLLIFGEPGCGKSSVLRLLRHEIGRTAPTAHVLLVDPRRKASDGDGDGGGIRRLPELVEALRDRIRRGANVAEDVYVLVDDYDLVSSAVAPLVEVMPYARDIGLHLVLARHAANAARALYEPLPAAVREAGAAGLQMSGRPDEAPVLGLARPRPLPAGRGFLVTRAGERTIQVAWIQPDARRL